MGVIKGDTRSLDYCSYNLCTGRNDSGYSGLALLLQLWPAESRAGTGNTSRYWVAVRELKLRVTILGKPFYLLHIPIMVT